MTDLQEREEQMRKQQETGEHGPAKGNNPVLVNVLMIMSAIAFFFIGTQIRRRSM